MYFFNTDDFSVHLQTKRYLIQDPSLEIKSCKFPDQLPVVYIYLMIACSIGCCFVEFQSDIIPYFMKRKAYMCKVFKFQNRF